MAGEIIISKAVLISTDDKEASLKFESGASTNVDTFLPKQGGKLAVDSEVLHKTGDETSTGTKTFRNLVSDSTLSGVLGFKSTSVGAVLQLTSKATAVTLDKSCGTITTNSIALASGAVVSFVLNNSTITENDIVLVQPDFTNAAIYYNAWVGLTQNGSCTINIKNIHTASLSDALKIKFIVIKASL